MKWTQSDATASAIPHLLYRITSTSVTHAWHLAYIKRKLPPYLTAWLAVALSTTRGWFTIPAALLSTHFDRRLFGHFVKCISTRLLCDCIINRPRGTHWDRRLFGHFVKCISTRLLCDRLTAPGVLIRRSAYSAKYGTYTFLAKIIRTLASFCIIKLQPWISP